MEYKIIKTAEAPAPIGPYVQAINVGGFIFVSGQIPLDPKTMRVVEGDVSAQTARVLKNLAAILESAGASLEYVVKTTIFLKSMNDFESMNKVYEEFFRDILPTMNKSYGEFSMESFPARSTVEVSRLPKDVLVEIDAIAYNPR